MVTEEDHRDIKVDIGSEYSQENLTKVPSKFKVGSQAFDQTTKNQPKISNFDTKDKKGQIGMFNSIQENEY